MRTSKLIVALALATGCATTQTDIADPTIGGQTFHVFREGPMPAAGVMTTIVMKPLGVRPDTIRVWVGDTETSDALKTVAVYDANDGDFDADITCGNPLPGDAQIWFEITAGDSVATGSVDIR